MMHIGSTILNLERIVKKLQNVCWMADCEHAASAGVCEMTGCTNQICNVHSRKSEFGRICDDCRETADCE